MLSFLFGMTLFAQSWKDSLQHGISAYAKGDFTTALQKIISAQRLAPDDVNLAGDIGTSAYRAGDFATAESAFESMVNNKTTGNIAAHPFELWHNKGNSQFKQENYAGAIESYKNALRLNPNSQSSRYNLAMAQRRLKEQQQNKDNQDNQDSDNQENTEPKDENGNSDNNASNEDQQENKEEETQNQSDSQEQQKDDKNAASQPDKRTERVLDELTKKEQETKQRVLEQEARQKRKGSTQTGKNW